MNPVARSHFISTLIASFLSGVNRRSFCLIGLAVGETFKECSIFSRGTPSMSADFQANTLALARSKEMSVLSYFGVDVSPNLHGLGGVIEAEANLLSFLGLGGGARRLQRWDL